MIIDEVQKFLEKIPPFQFLDRASLRDAVKGMSLEYYPKDTVILKQDGPPSDSLRIVRQGGVRISVRSGAGDDMVVDLRGEGDNFGIVSLMSKDRQRTTVTAIDDTACYLLPREQVYRLIESHPAFTEYLLQTHFTKYIDKTYREMHNKSLQYGSSDHLLFTTQVGDVAAKAVLTIAGDASIGSAAREMARNHISSIVVLDGSGQPAGIVTDRDLREKVVAHARSYDDPVSGIMSAPLVLVDARDYCFEAILKMIRGNIHHILVVKEGALTGVLTNHDLMLLQGSSPLSFAKDLESQETVEGLVPLAVKINRVVGLLLKEGARGSSIARIITELHDRLVRKVLTIAEQRFGRPPVPYCWIVFGSEGRKEQAFKTYQDNAVILADRKAEVPEEVRRYFEALTAFVRDGLLQCGFPLNARSRMASDPAWCQPLEVWKRYVFAWITTPKPATVENAPAFFDFRPVFGDDALAGELRIYLDSVLTDRKMFFERLAERTVRNAPPMGFFRSFVVEKGGAHKNKLNLRDKGIAPLVDCIRLFALERGIRETSTIERIEALRADHPIVHAHADEIVHAFEFLMLLRIHHRYAGMLEGGTPDNFVDPDTLSQLEKRSLKDAFQLIAKVQGLIVDRYSSVAW